MLTAPEGVTEEIQEGVELAPIPIVHIYDQHQCQPEWQQYNVNTKVTAEIEFTLTETYRECKMMQCQKADTLNTFEPQSTYTKQVVPENNSNIL